MSLSAALNTAQQIFSNTATQTSVTSKNLANKDNANYARRAAITATTLYGATIVTIERSQDVALLRQTLNSTSQYSAQKELNDGLKQLSDIFGGNDQALSPSTAMTKLQTSLQDYSAKPNDKTLGSAVVNNAINIVNVLNDATQTLQQVRTDADKSIDIAVTKLNDLLKQFKVANDAAQSATAAGLDPNDAMDTREAVLKQISEIVGVTALRREPNDMVLFTNEGTTLFETSPRTVTFSPTLAYSASTIGSGIKIDGVPLSPGTGGNTTGQGSLSGLLQLRDQVAPVLQKQLDEMARGLITAFSESDNGSPPVVKPGLFTWSGGTVPPAGTAVPDLASRITVSAAVNPAVSGDPSKIRDGSINGAAFNDNPTGSASFSTTLQAYATAMNTPMSVDPTTELDPNSSLVTLASKAVGWLEDIRSSSSTAADNKDAMLSRATEAYSNSTGVNLDEELSLLLDLEHAYSASSKLLTTIDEMLKSLLNAAG